MRAARVYNKRKIEFLEIPQDPIVKGSSLIKVNEISEFDSSEYDVQKDALKNDLLARKRNQNMQSWFDNLKDNAEIVDNRNYFY